MRKPNRRAHALAFIAALASASASASAAAQVLEVAPDGAVTMHGQAAVRTRAAPRRCGSHALAPAFEAAARRYDLSVDLLVNVAQVESNCDTNAVSSAGAIGVMQLMPATARELGVDPRNPEQNILGGAAYLRAQLDRFDGRIDLALAAYNAGPAAVARRQAPPPYPETRRYLERNFELLADRSLSTQEHAQ